jgi:hypothetical protein
VPKKRIFLATMTVAMLLVNVAPALVGGRWT